ncbi:hypothetical protein [Polyangium sorediatum]|uniref:Lipoprotein n=1 Tax=Polyangium sorediatum TaxID=889274 RepID=A0ABT6NIT1_9BACT|nr:hypothetical protein [Polyangium sorediatum]MDI1428219.1 hypothetical protein [Polyangium sorediatum]
MSLGKTSAMVVVILIGANAMLPGCYADPEGEPLTQEALPDDVEWQETDDTSEASDALTCTTTTYWTPTPASETDYSGTQYNGSISTGIRVEVRQSGTGLEARVCKSSGSFSNDIAFSIYDGATSSSVGTYVWNLSTNGKTCSSWVFLSNSNAYSPGQQFGGIWQVVSPASSASGWSFPYSGCSVSGSPGGTCWNGVSITMNRTCKL